MQKEKDKNVPLVRTFCNDENLSFIPRYNLKSVIKNLIPMQQEI